MFLKEKYLIEIRLNARELHLVTEYSWDKIILLLLKIKVKVNIRDSLKRAALHWVISMSHISKIKFLLEIRADIEKNKYNI